MRLVFMLGVEGYDGVKGGVLVCARARKRSRDDDGDVVVYLRYLPKVVLN
jgi:hypothetical protein